MKKLEDLKTDLINNKIENVYIFFGEDVGIRHHYIDKINTYFDNKVVSDSVKAIQPYITAKSLFSMKQLYVIYNDEDFVNMKKEKVQRLFSRLNKDYTCIFVYDSDKFTSTPLFKNFEELCTEFQVVQPNIAIEFVEEELPKLGNENEKEFAFNCENLYSNILLEADKVKQYQASSGLSQSSSYEILQLKNQMLYKDRRFECVDFMDDVLLKKYTKLAYWLELSNVPENQDLIFANLNNMYSDFLIAGLCSKYGKYDGGKRAFSYNLYWGRIVVIREYILKEDCSYYFNCAYKIADLDNLVKTGKVIKSKILEYVINDII